jgi:hypothetical protein
MRARETIAFLCFLLSCILCAALGLLYLFSPKFMPYHAIAIGTSWEELTPAYQALFLALIRGVGGGFLASATACFILLFIPYRAKAAWARWALLIVGLLVGVSMLYASLIVMQETPASPPWYAATLGIALTIVGFVLYKPVAPAAVTQGSQEVSTSDQ